MTYYSREIERIKNICYSNRKHLDTVVKTRHYIDTHFDTQLNLNLLSHIRCTSKFHLLRLFKKYYGQTPKQYITEKRLIRAKDLLAKGFTVSQTCYDIGFECPSSFSTLFKDRFGLTPSDFQKKSNFHKA